MMYYHLYIHVSTSTVILRGNLCSIKSLPVVRAEGFSQKAYITFTSESEQSLQLKVWLQVYSWNQGIFESFLPWMYSLFEIQWYQSWKTTPKNGHKNVVSQDRWSVVTGSVMLKCRSFCREYIVFQDRWCLMAVVSEDRCHCTTN